MLNAVKTHKSIKPPQPGKLAVALADTPRSAEDSPAASVSTVPTAGGPQSGEASGTPPAAIGLSESALNPGDVAGGAQDKANAGARPGKQWKGREGDARLRVLATSPRRTIS